MSEKRSNLIDVGRISGAFGVKGWVKVVSNTEPADNIVKYSPWWLKTQHGVKSFEVMDFKQNANGMLVHLKGVDDRDLASEYKSTTIAVEKSQLVDLEDGDYYWHQLIGLKVVSEYDGRSATLGVVKDILETGANDVLVVEPDDVSDDGGVEKRQRLVPYLPGDYVTRVSLQEKQITVNWDPDF